MYAWQLLTLTTVIGLVLGTVGVAQTETQQTFTRDLRLVGDGPLYLPSPLDADFSSFSHSKKSGESKLEKLTINIAPAVASYAKIKNCDLEQARFDALEYFGALRGNIAETEDAVRPQFRPLSADRFEVTAPTEYFRSLPGLIRSFEMGKKSIVVEVEYVDLDDTIQKEVRKFLIADSVKHISGQIPELAGDLPAEQSPDNPYQVTSTLRTSQSLPVTVGKMDEEHYQRFKKLVNARANCQLRGAPTVAMFPGQDTMVQEAAIRPFVVGVGDVPNDVGTLHQPIIQTLEDGDFFKVNCNPMGERIKINCSLAFAKIVKVDVLDIEELPNGNTISVQTPTQQIRQVTLAAMLEEDRVLFVDPYHVRTSEVETNGQKRTLKHHVIALVRAKVISDE